MIKSLKYLKKIHWLYIIITLGLLVLVALCDLKLPVYMEDIVKVIQNNGTIGQIWDVGYKILIATLISIVATVIVGFFASYIGASFSQNIRTKLFNKVNSFSMNEINKFSTSSLITRCTNDVTQLQMVIVMLLRTAFSAPIMAVGALINVIQKSKELTLATAVAVFLMLCLVLFMFIVVVPKFTKLQKQTDHLNLVTRENLTGLRVVRAYSTENLQQAKFDDVNQNLTKTQLFVNRVTSTLMPIMQLVISGLLLTIFWLGAVLIDQGKFDLPSLTGFTQYAMMLLMNFMMLSMLFVLIPRGSVSAKRINEVLDTPLTILDGKGRLIANNMVIDEQVVPLTPGKVEFKNVSFKYPDAEGYVLEDISFVVNPGETVAFIGSTGSGKSTLINLVPRFYDVTKGQVLVDGVDVKDYKVSDLNSKLGYVPQKGVLFSGDVKENVKFAKNDITDEDIDKALKISQANFVYDLKDGVNHEISQGGKNVSGGQKQRLSIARAIAVDPEIYIFDDSFSALDYKTDKKLRDALKQNMQGKTSLIVAQRIGTIMDADKIIVLDEGKMVGIGTHKKLLKDCKVYQEIAYSQLSKEEL